MHSTDFFVLFVITAGIVLLASSFYQRGRSSYDFITAGRNVPGWLLGLSIFATYLHSTTYMGYPGNAFKGDWSIIIYTLPIPFIAWAAGRWAVPYFRRHEDISAFTLLEERFGLKTRRYVAHCYLLSQVLRTGVILFLMCLPIADMLGWNIYLCIILTSTLATTYSMLGGLKGVVWAEAVQGILVITAIVVCIAILTNAMPNGLGSAFETARESGKFSLGRAYEKTGQASIYIIFIYSIISTCGRFFFDQSHVQRYHAATNNKMAKHSILIGALVFSIATVLLMVIGTMLYCYYSEFSVMLPNNIPHDYIFPFFVINQMPVGVSGLLVASLLASGMAAFSSYLVSGASTILYDLNTELAHSHDDKKRQKAINRGCILLSMSATLTALFLTVAMQWTGMSWILSTLLLGCVIGAFFLAITLKGAKQKVIAIAVAAGFLASIATYVWAMSGNTDASLHIYISAIIGIALTLLTGFLLNKVANHASPTQEDE